MANAGQIVAALRDIGATKDLTPDEVNELMKDGILAALVRLYGANVEAEIDIDDVTGEFDIVVLKRVVEEVEDEATEISLEDARWDDDTYEVGDIMEIVVDFSQFGRNAVMAMKQRIVQRVREGERERIRDEFNDKVGDLLSGEVQQVERSKMVVLLNRARDADAIIPWRDQNPRERFRQGDPIRAVLKKVDETSRGPRLILSRADPLFVSALFHLEVPEIGQKIVEIREIAREVGGRTKIAVYSHDESIDPVGACVGLKGSRVQAVVSELGGERIDIVPWHPEPEVFARRALAPARVAKVISDPDRQVITAVVDEGGADFPLFASGEDQYETSNFALSELDIPAATLAALNTAGYNTFLDIIDLEKKDFLGVDGLDEAEADRLLGIIDQLTVVEGDGAAQESSSASEGPGGEALSAAESETADEVETTGEPEAVGEAETDEKPKAAGDAEMNGASEAAESEASDAPDDSEE